MNQVPKTADMFVDTLNDERTGLERLSQKLKADYASAIALGEIDDPLDTHILRALKHLRLTVYHLNKVRRITE